MADRTSPFVDDARKELIDPQFIERGVRRPLRAPLFIAGGSEAFAADHFNVVDGDDQTIGLDALGQQLQQPADFRLV